MLLLTVRAVSRVVRLTRKMEPAEVELALSLGCKELEDFVVLSGHFVGDKLDIQELSAYSEDQVRDRLLNRKNRRLNRKNAGAWLFERIEDCDDGEEKDTD